MLYANGIGPLTQDKNKKRAVAALEKVEKITLRDERSQKTLETLGLKNTNVLVTADAAFRFTEADSEGAGALLDNIMLTGQLAVKKYFCISIRGWKTLKEDFIPEMAVFCDYMTEKYGLVPLFIPMQPSNDAEISTRILEKLKNRGYYLEENFTIEEILAIVKGSEFLVGMCLHSIIYGANGQTPVIGLVYDPKVANFISYMNEKTQVNTSSLDLPALKRMIDEIMQNPVAAKEKIARRTRAS
jgi:polysaccharide pyruvyl transferase WcaK-like protein